MTDSPQRLPFQDLDSRAWQNLALAATAALYLSQIWKERHRLFWFLGADFMAYWSSGYIANHNAFSKIYDFAALEAAQHLMLFGKTLPNVFFPPLPMAYLPVFVLPFQLLALLPPAPSFSLWTAFNLALGIGYLIFFVKKIESPRVERSEPNALLDSSQKRLILLFLFSFPVFDTLFWGQINLWLLVFVGEFLRAFHEEKEFRAGLWLSAFLLKPQLLILLPLALFFSKRFKILAGAAVGGGALLLASFFAAGKEGCLSCLRLWLGYSHNLATSGVEAMGNWRMVAENLNRLLPSAVWGIAALALSLFTILWGIFLWVRAKTPIHAPLLLLATLAATLLATWHSHAHMAVVLIPPMLWLLLQDQFPQKLLNLWLFLPPLFYLIGLGIVLFVHDRFYQGLLFGPAQMILNLLILVWTSREMIHDSMD